MKLIDIVQELCSGAVSEGDILRCDEDGTEFLVGSGGLVSARIGGQVYSLGYLVATARNNGPQPGQ